MRNLWSGLLAAALILVSGALHSGDAQTRLTESMVDRAASRPIHGIGREPQLSRRQVAADAQALGRYAAWLEGRGHGPARWDSATVLWRLADSDNPAFLPLLLRLADSPNENVANMAIYGLARHAGNTNAAARLRQAGARSAPRERRYFTAVALLHVGDASARELLSRVFVSDLPRSLTGEVEWIRAQPAPAQHKGYWPCEQSLVLRRSAAGTHTCQAP